ncbi:protein kinase [Streptomyces sp. NPDC002888]|uniref:serine/threonine-protein kinase n=1 Tax=Streptomyces sp. NPDC002888 TaxID=3364668 RepID=UPI003678FDE0
MNEGDSGRRVVDSRFELRVRLGGGGMGTVWRAHDLVLQRDVAIKEVRPPDAEYAHDPDRALMLRERVLREARALARIEHPNVVTIHHIVDGGEGTYPWIVMELVEGGSLADRLARGPMTPADAADLGRGVLDALRAAHDAGVEHRDVKPANVLLRADGRPVLTDFGIAAIREATTLTATGSIIGTPDYMAPERVSGAAGGPAADLWSLAMMLYVAVEGHHPLRRGTTLATLAAVLHEDVPPPTRAGALTPLLTRVLVRDPAARPDAGAVARMLEAVARGGAEAEWAGAQGGTAQGGGVSPVDAAPAWVSSQVDAAPAWVSSQVDAGPASASPPTGSGPNPTSYPLAPPAWPAPHHVPADTPQHASTDARPPARPRRVTVLAVALGAVVVGGALWVALPGGEGGSGGSLDNAGGTQRTSAVPSGTADAVSDDSDAPSAAAEASDTPSDDETAGPVTDLLTPAGIREVVDAFEKKTGSRSYGDLSVYPEHATAEVMVSGSQTRYDTFDYWVDRGVETSIIKGTLFNGDKPVRADDFDWDVLPALLARAEKELKVDKPTSRYLLLRQPNDRTGQTEAMAVYISNDYGEGGYVEADPQGKVTKVVPSG